MNEDLWPNWDDNLDDDQLEFEREGFEPAEVRYPMQDREVGDHYRSPGDDVNVVRVHNPDPHGYVRIAKNMAVAGVSFRLGEVTAFVFGNEQSLTLVAEPTNQYDPNAIMVMGSHQDNDGQWHEEHIGYVPKKLAAEVKADELVIKLKTMFVPYQGKSPGVRMDLWKEDDLFAGNDDQFPFTLPEPVDLSDFIPDEKPVSVMDLAMLVVKGEPMQQLPPPQDDFIDPITVDTSPE
jgi:hypothetical protein